MIPISKISPANITSALKELTQALKVEYMDLQSSLTTTRKTYSFGYNYFTLRDGDNTFTPIPNCLQQICKASINSFDNKCDLGNYQDYLNVIVSFYECGYQLEPHVDVDFSDRFTDGRKVNFYFGEHVIGVILQPDKDGKFYLVKSENEDLIFQSNKIIELEENMGTTFLLTGKHRRKPYYHGVSKVTQSRISVTFRTVIFC